MPKGIFFEKNGQCARFTSLVPPLCIVLISHFPPLFSYGPPFGNPRVCNRPSIFENRKNARRDFIPRSVTAQGGGGHPSLLEKGDQFYKIGPYFWEFFFVLGALFPVRIRSLLKILWPLFKTVVLQASTLCSPRLAGAMLRTCATSSSCDATAPGRARPDSLCGRKGILNFVLCTTTGAAVVSRGLCTRWG